MAVDYKDYYKILGVDKKASEKEIRSAYRKLARKYHPDVNPGDQKAEATFKKINAAYEVLPDAEKRKKFGKQYGRQHRWLPYVGRRRRRPGGDLRQRLPQSPAGGAQGQQHRVSA